LIRQIPDIDFLTHGSPKTGYQELPRLCGKEDEKSASNALQKVSGRSLKTTSTAALDLLNYKGDANRETRRSRGVFRSNDVGGRVDELRRAVAHSSATRPNRPHADEI
jgi:hypothetical protein